MLTTIMTALMTPITAIRKQQQLQQQKLQHLNNLTQLHTHTRFTQAIADSLTTIDLFNLTHAKLTLSIFT